ncbi:hypothetical protein E1B28_003394 [Marasmius oreades]|uniref:Uncharacterized protein n=1 Tax=Marasmius oreades TaxID=181124 RepID=A0A9P7RLW3_9AGAR|nr:uncharacterized protein E1B28_003394 [Marasmius oreades]KAG7085860.1 hypothetical protein E1B28_003394 [Marasmius oreades]
MERLQVPAGRDISEDDPRSKLDNLRASPPKMSANTRQGSGFTSVGTTRLLIS